MPAAPKGWLLYTRVSTEDQAQGGVSLDQQLAACRAYCTAKGWTIAEEVTDPGASAASLNRPGMRRVIEAMRKRAVAGIIVWRLDRLTRALRDLLTLVDLSDDGAVGIVSVTESLDTSSPMGRFTVHLLGAIAQWEKETIGHRTSSAMQHARGQGYYTGGTVPAGCKVVPTEDGKRRKLELSAGSDLLKEAWGWIATGDGLVAIARRLNAAGIPSARRLGGAKPKQWTSTSVRTFLLSRQVVGLYVDADTQAKVRAILASRSSPTRRGVDRDPGSRATDPTPLAGLVRCPLCQGTLIQVTGTGNGGTYRYFRCSNRMKGKTCQQKDVRAEPIEAEVVAALAVAMQPDGIYAAAIRQESQASRLVLGERQAERVRLTSERDQLSGRVASLTMQGQIGGAAWAEAMRLIGTELERTDRRLAELAGEIAVAEVDNGSLDYLLDEMAKGVANLSALPAGELGAALRMFIQSVHLTPEKTVLELYRPGKRDTPGVSGGGSCIANQWGPGRHAERTVRAEIDRTARPWPVKGSVARGPSAGS